MEDKSHLECQSRQILKRPSADKTRCAILRAATRLFAKNGFEKTSIRDIAKAAKVNQTLISHHYGNKESLWMEVRLGIANKYAVFSDLDSLLKIKNLKHFLERLVKDLFGFWQNNADALQILNWQRLEGKHGQTEKYRSSYSLRLQDAIATFQRQGKMRDDVGADVIMLLIFNATRGALDEFSFVFATNKQKRQEEYLQLVIDSLYRALKP